MRKGVLIIILIITYFNAKSQNKYIDSIIETFILDNNIDSSLCYSIDQYGIKIQSISVIIDSIGTSHQLEKVEKVEFSHFLFWNNDETLNLKAFSQHDTSQTIHIETVSIISDFVLNGFNIKDEKENPLNISIIEKENGKTDTIYVYEGEIDHVNVIYLKFNSNGNKTLKKIPEHKLVNYPETNKLISNIRKIINTNIIE